MTHLGDLGKRVRELRLAQIRAQYREGRLGVAPRQVRPSPTLQDLERQASKIVLFGTRFGRGVEMWP